MAYMRGEIEGRASKSVVGQCKGMDRAELERDVEGARGPCDMEKASQSCYPPPPTD